MKKGILITVIIIAAFVFVDLLIISMTAFLSYTPHRQRNEMIEYYSNDENYITVVGKVTEVIKVEEGALYVTVNEKENDESLFLEVQPEFEEILYQNGLYFEANNEVYYSFVIAPRIWWDGWKEPIVAVYSEDGSMTYLDYETGKSFYVEYMRSL